MRKEEALELARAVLKGQPRSYVESARRLAEHILFLEADKRTGGHADKPTGPEVS